MSNLTGPQVASGPGKFYNISSTELSTDLVDNSLHFRTHHPPQANHRRRAYRGVGHPILPINRRQTILMSLSTAYPGHKLMTDGNDRQLKQRVNIKNAQLRCHAVYYLASRSLFSRCSIRCSVFSIVSMRLSIASRR